MIKYVLFLICLYLPFLGISQNDGYNIILTISDGGSFRTSGFKKDYFKSPTKTTTRNLGASARVGLPMKYGKYEIISGIDFRQKGYFNNFLDEFSNNYIYGQELTFYNLEIPFLFKIRLNYAETCISTIFGFSYGRQIHSTKRYPDYHGYYFLSNEHSYFLDNTPIEVIDYNKNSLDIIIGIELSRQINNKLSVVLTPEFSNGLISYQLDNPRKPRINQLRVNFGIIKKITRS